MHEIGARQFLPRSRARLSSWAWREFELEATFVSEAKKLCLVGIKGHRSVGGMRASIYNAMPLEGCKTLAEFMKEFQKKNG